MDTFFGLHISTETTGGMVCPLLLAVLLGGLIGLERELHGHPAGLRTHILVCVGATLMTLVSVHLVGRRGDPSRIAAQIVTGIGFLGAGAIIREGATIRGLTTAASVWTTAGIGLAVGATPRLGELAVIATLIVLFTLWILNRFEEWMEVKGRRLLLLELHVREGVDLNETIGKHFEAHGIVLRSIRREVGREPNVRHLLLRVRVPARLNRAAFLAQLVNQPEIISAHLE